MDLAKFVCTHLGYVARHYSSQRADRREKNVHESNSKIALGSKTPARDGDDRETIIPKIQKARM